jgi:dTDP-L-rhamnose 4-epimerase
VISGQFRVGDTRHTVSDITALSDLGWSAEIPLKRTVERYIEWIRPFHGTREYLDAAEAAMQKQNVVRRAGL